MQIFPYWYVMSDFSRRKWPLFISFENIIFDVFNGFSYFFNPSIFDRLLSAFNDPTVFTTGKVDTGYDKSADSFRI